MDDVYSSKNSQLKNSRLFSQFICHRMPERTFKIKGRYFPVCSRCTGLYIGAFLFYVYSLFFLIDYSEVKILMALLSIFPLLIDGLTQFFRFRESNNVLRLVTGFVAGIGLAILFSFFKILIY